MPSPKATDLWLEFSNQSTGLCGLCGNTGRVNTLGARNPTNSFNTGVVAYCICPNGRIRKMAMSPSGKKFSMGWGDSVIRKDER